MKKVAIISTGNELIYGNVHESNCFFLSNKLFPTDFDVVFHITVGDAIEDLKYAITEARQRADITIITGGLGPTDDDYTLEVLGSLFGFKTFIYEPGRQKMEKFFHSISRTVMGNDLKQVTVPEGAIIFDNDVGLAAGFVLSWDDKMLIAMPGVPVEMHYMFENMILPFLLKEYMVGRKSYLAIKVIMMREAHVNELIKGLDIELDKIDWGITTEWGMNTITFVQKGNFDFMEQKILNECIGAFGDRMLSQESENLEMELFNLLREKKLTISIAESCTGGLISKRITDIPGSSEVFAGGLVVYNNSSKINLLGVSENSINDFGAVSEHVAKEMAEGVKIKFGSDIGISITGIAGPGGGSEEKPVGTVCFGFATPDGIESFMTDIKSYRDRIRFFSSQYALDHVRIYLKNTK